jgi:hypothetical protein
LIDLFGQLFIGLCHYSTDMSPHNGIGHIIARHRWGKGGTSVWVDEDWHIHDWAPMRWKSSFSLTEHCWVPTRWRRHIRSSRWRLAYTWLASTRRKLSSSLTHPVYIWYGDGVVMTGFRQYKGHPHAFHPLAKLRWHWRVQMHPQKTRNPSWNSVKQ